jgi:hypothetical protein
VVAERAHGRDGGRGGRASGVLGNWGGRVPQARLPAQPGPLVGRGDAAAEATRALLGGDVRLLTRTGPAGVGKTRLGLAVAADAGGTFPDGA